MVNYEIQGIYVPKYIVYNVQLVLCYAVNINTRGNIKNNINIFNKIYNKYPYNSYVLENNSLSEVIVNLVFLNVY